MTDIWGRIYLDHWHGDRHPHAFHRDDGNVDTAESADHYFVVPRGDEVDQSLGVFDAIICMGNTFGIGSSPDHLPRRLDRMRRALSPNGRLLAALIDPLATDAPHHLCYHERNRGLGRPPGFTRARPEYRGELGEWWNLWMPTESELRAALATAGWEVRQATPAGSSRLWDLAPR